MKISKKLLISCLVVVAFFASVVSTKAATLSQTNVSLTPGQSLVVSAYNTLNSLYLSGTPNTSIATVVISGNNINIYGVSTGNTSATICEYNSICNTIYITVSGANNGYNNYGNLSLSQTSLSLTVGQTSLVTAYNSSYSYATLYVSSNSSPNVATATISGNNISIYGNSAGVSNIIVCQNNSVSYCGTVYVTVTGGYNTYNNTSSGLNISSLTLPRGGAMTIASANSLGLSVSNNSNPGVATTSYASVVSGCAVGALYSTITGQPCSNLGNNGGYYPSVAGCTVGALYNILTGQPCYNGNNYGYGNNYSNNYNTGSSVQILAVTRGTDTITLCQNNSACSAIYITVY
jgi:hypothetical protein